ncbi:MAG: DUF1501 domain-containing protein [Bacteroidetes bacterium]|nr:DUF1501 domain-containing protein [Bacteroidota bacterium]
MQRRKFLKNIGAGVAIPSLLSGFGVKAYANSPLSPFFSALSTDTDHVLVMIQLSGGNDGLNTLVPINQYDNLAKGRPEVILPKNKLLALSGNDTLGFHPALGGLRDLYDNGNLRIVQNVGYPNPNLSHFRSTDIWMSGSDSNEYFSSGWAGRYLNYEYPNFPNGYPNADMPHPLAIEIGTAMSMSLMGPQTGMGYVISNPDEFYNLISGVQSPAPGTPAGEQLAYIRLIAQQSRTYAQTIVSASGNVAQQSAYPDTGLAAKLKIVARLIAGGLKTRMYLVNIDGFDTHDAQVDPNDHTLGAHASLLQELGDAIAAFSADLKFLGVDDRVSGMTFSEFGRRIVSNYSVGTDHGEAAPMFLFGKPVAGGISGSNPVIPSVPTDYDNVAMEFDFRSVYASILKDWFCVPDTDVPGILQHDLPYLNLFDPNLSCLSTSTHQANQHAGASLIVCNPNPFVDSVQIEYTTEGGPTIVQILDAAGKLVATPVQGISSRGAHQTLWNGAHLPAGNYYCRLLNGASYQTKALIKVKG